MNDREMGWCQVILGFLLLTGYFGVIGLFCFGVVRVPTDYKEAFMALLGVLTASVVQVFSYFYARQRATGGST